MMTLTAERELVSVEDFLKKEAQSEVKHEYLAGMVYAMAGASEAHNVIAMNLYTALGNRLRGKICQPFGSDMKLKLHPLRGDTYFYYPDAMVACDAADSGHGWRERPSVLLEIVSEETRRVDEREKRLAYLQLESLDAYVRIEQDRAEVAVDRRVSGDWEVERLAGFDAVIELPTIGVELPVAELYDRLKL